MRSITALIPTFNRSRYLPEALDSVLGQTIAPTQIVVIDDGSTDETGSVLARYGKHIEVIVKPNGGKASSVNVGLARARGEFVWVFDDDDVALFDAMARLIEPMIQREELDFVYSGHYLGQNGPDGRILRGRLYRVPLVREDALLQALTEGAFFNQQGVLARRRCFDRIGGYDETFKRGQDYELLLRMARVCRGFGIAEPTYIFRQHGGVRGPIGAQHSSEDRERAWMECENRIGLRIREQLPLEAFLDDDESQISDGWRRRRLALLHRAASMASKGLSAEVASDLVDAATISSHYTLDERETELCRRLITREFMQAALRVGAPQFLSALLPLRHTSAGREMLRAMARGMLWVARQRSPEHIGRIPAVRIATQLVYLSRR
jgi:hypothetical protein